MAVHETSGDASFRAALYLERCLETRFGQTRPSWVMVSAACWHRHLPREGAAGIAILHEAMPSAGGISLAQIWWRCSRGGFRS
jgi:hypothetical protein